MGIRMLASFLLAVACTGCGGDDGASDAGMDGGEGGGASCGDGTRDEGEACDDGNGLSGDGCRADCLGVELCGDGILDVGEGCDEGEDNGGDGDCTRDCIPRGPFDSVDGLIEDLLDRLRIPGGSVAFSSGGRLVFARGYGMADEEAALPAEPATLFRIASVSKPITSVAIHLLAEEGHVDVAAPAFSYLDHLGPPEGAAEDPRLVDVTVEDLLIHAGGWDIEALGYDPMFIPGDVAAALDVPPPAGADDVVRYMRGQPLSFDPGARFSYSNFGYNVLGRIIEAVSDEAYEPWVLANVLLPMGIEGMAVGHTRLEDRFEGEAYYYHPRSIQSVFPDEGVVPVPYGGLYVESLDSHGGWVANVVDLTRFLIATDGQETVPDLLEAATTEAMTARPDLADWDGENAWYGRGWSAQGTEGRAETIWHGGSLPGTAATILSTHDGLTWAALFNFRDDAAISEFHGDIDATLADALGSVDSWPEGYDLFDRHQL